MDRDPRHPQAMLRGLGLSVIALGIYIMGYGLVHPFVGLPGVLLVIPTIVAGWQLGSRLGLTAGVVIAAVTMVLSVSATGSWERISQAWLGLVVAVLTTGLVGWFRERYDRSHHQAQLLGQAQAALGRLNAELEARVTARTAELTQANAHLRELNDTLETLISASPIAIIVTNAHGHIQRANPAASRLLGLPEKALLGKSVAEFDPELVSLLPALEQGGALNNIELLFRTPRGETIDASLSLAPLHNAAGAITGFVSLVTDITAHKQAEAEIQTLNTDLERRVQERTEQLTAANAQLEAFGSMVAHDLRSPLTTVQSYSDVLMMHYAGQQLDAQAQELLMQMQDASERMARLIQDLFDFSRTSHDELRRGPVDISRVCQAIAEDLRARNPQRQVLFQIADGLATDADARYLRVLFDNLLENAWKYSSHRPLARIEVGETLVNGAQTFFVRDNGAGFDMANAAHLFQPFQRLHRQDDFTGVGLGLATCKRIIERHGGRIWVKSEVDEGATFYFTLTET